MAVDKHALLAVSLPESEVEVEGVGSVRVRGLTRAEVQEIFRDGSRDEHLTIAIGLVEPKLTNEEAASWVAAATWGQVHPVLVEIMRLSGMMPGTDKETWKEMESDPDAEFPVLPGGEVGDDGGSDEGGDL